MKLRIRLCGYMVCGPLSQVARAKLYPRIEKRGIGRPSTYASILETIQERQKTRIGIALPSR